jgi:hypothetical protein
MKLDFTDTEVFPAVNYYFSFTCDVGDYQDICQTYVTTDGRYDSGLYYRQGAGGVYSDTTDYNFIINYDPFFESSQDEYYVANLDPELVDWRSDINTVANLNCMIGYECRLYFSYNDQAVGNNVYLTPDVPGQQNPNFATASTTIEFTPLYQDYVIVPPESTTTSTDVCLYMHDTEYGDMLYCSIHVYWFSEDILDEKIDELLFYDITTVCDDVSTSTGTFWDDFRYGIECGARKTMYWAFVPHSKDILTDFNRSLSVFENSFPFNTYFSLIGSINNSIASSSLENDGTIDIPMIREGVSGPEYYMMPVFSSTSIPNMIGQQNYILLRTTISYFLWAGSALGIVLMLTKF